MSERYALRKDNGTWLNVVDPFGNKNSVEQPAAIHFIRQLLADIAERDAQISELTAERDEARTAYQVRNTEWHQHELIALALAERHKLRAECDQWKEELRIYRETEDAECEGLRSFANSVMESWPHGDVDGGYLQDIAVKHGLIALKDPKPTEPCGDNCACSGYPSPEEWADGIDCYVRTELLTGKIDAAMGRGEGGS